MFINSWGEEWGDKDLTSMPRAKLLEHLALLRAND
jgi:hypothetical protein